MSIKNNQNGFSAIEVIITVVILIALVGIGYLVYKDNHKALETQTTSKVSTQTKSNTTKTQSQPKSTTTATTKQPAISYFTIQQWGVEAPNNSALGLSYNITASESNIAWLNSQELATSDPSSCEESSTGNAGYIGKYLPTDNVSTDPNSQESAKQFLSQDFAASGSAAPYYAQIGGYYYIYWNGQNSCTSNADLINQVRSQIGSIVDKLQAVPN